MAEVKDRETLISLPVRGNAAMQGANFVADSLLEEAVRSEFVSGRPKFPASKENTGNFRYYLASATRITISIPYLFLGRGKGR